jgi:hypothetical protein
LSQGVPCATYLLTWWFPEQVRNWHLAAREPSWFLLLTWSGDAMHGWGVELSEFCLFLVVFPARCISSISLRVYFRKHAFCYLPLVAILESLHCVYIPHFLDHLLPDIWVVSRAWLL